MKKDRREFFAQKEEGEKIKKGWGKKQWIVFSSVVAAVLVAVTVGLCLYFFVFKKAPVYTREYLSEKSFTRAELLLELSDNVSVSEYDVDSDVFVTESSYIDGLTKQGVVLYGFADRKKEYCRPYFSSVISIKGDYAIVTRSGGTDYLDGVSYIGLVKFRGKGAENGILNVTDFSMKYNAANPEQFYFCGDYLCIMGDKDAPSSSASYSTFYDYRSHDQLLECFRIRYGYDANSGKNYVVRQYENYLVAYNDKNAFFFDVYADRFGGYLELNDKGAYSSPYTSTDYTVGLSVLYMGNGWFVRYAYQTSSEPFSGYKLCYQALNTDGGATLVFARTTTDFYNVNTGVTKRIPQIYSILEVANAFSRADFAATANSYNNSVAAPDDFPCLNPADMIEDGYSILYYFYQPYIEKTELTDAERSLAKETFCILDKNMNVVMPDTLFPVVTVDGVGFETTDPYFDIAFGDAVLYTKKGKKTVLYGDALKSYAVVGTHDGCVTIASLDLTIAKGEKSEETGIKYGAATADGKMIVDCVYDRLSAFYGGYAVGAKVVGKEVYYYRIDEKGTETLLTDAYIMKDGVYVYKEGEKYGLKNYAGDVLLSADHDSVGMSDNYMISGVYQRSIVFATTGVKTYIYNLE